MAKTGTSVLGLAPKAWSNGGERTDNRITRLEKTSRWPRLLSQRGRNESSATKLVRNGKPLKLVLAPVNRIVIAPAWVRKNMAWPSTEGPKIRLPSCETTVGQPSF